MTVRHAVDKGVARSRLRLIPIHQSIQVADAIHLLFAEFQVVEQDAFRFGSQLELLALQRFERHLVSEHPIPLGEGEFEGEQRRPAGLPDTYSGDQDTDRGSN